MSENGRELLREIVETVALFAVIFTLARLTIGNYSILGRSMEPNYYQDERLLVDRITPRLGFLDRGDVVIAHSPREADTELIKRLIGKPGDTVELRENRIYVNGTALEEPYLPDGADSGPRDKQQAQWTLGENEYFLLGDNRSQSADSRSFGTIQSSNIVGRALLVYFPFDRFQFVKHHDYPGQ